MLWSEIDLGGGGELGVPPAHSLVPKNWEPLPQSCVLSSGRYLQWPCSLDVLPKSQAQAGPVLPLEFILMRQTWSS